MEKMQTQLFLLEDNGIFPNSKLPVVVYRNAFSFTEDLSDIFKETFKQNNWYNFWESGIFTYHHYHSNTHELMGVCRGSTILQFGGEDGTKVRIQAGDIVVIPAGVAHKNLMDENAVTCIGAYPKGYDYDMNYGKLNERPQADKNISEVPLPDYDPLFGKDAGLVKLWEQSKNDE
ncbi:cupin domain-containing protein [Taibaiella lutea]|nr:cupin domain-containing protein [Taibaiella lutea]